MNTNPEVTLDVIRERNRIIHEFTEIVGADFASRIFMAVQRAQIGKSEIIELMPNRLLYIYSAVNPREDSSIKYVVILEYLDNVHVLRAHIGPPNDDSYSLLFNIMMKYLI